VKVYAGIDPLTGREIRFRKTCKTERAAQIELGRLLEQAAAGRQPDSGVTVAQLLDQYVSRVGWDVSTRESNLGYIRRTIKPAIGSTQVCKVRGPLLDTLYARLMRCGNLACTGKPFTEHRHIPDLRPDPADRRFEWQQAADRVRAAIRSGQLPQKGKARVRHDARAAAGDFKTARPSGTVHVKGAPRTGVIKASTTLIVPGQEHFFIQARRSATEAL
jgi:hypothetical protein